MAIHFYTTKHLFQKTKEVVADIVRQNPDIKTVLDVPAGAGALSQFLHEDLKLKVTASDIDPDKWKYNQIEFVPASMGRETSFAKSQFDMVVCLEGLKHFSDVSTAIKEFRRMIQPGGFFICTIPNDLAMQVRLRYFFDGFVDTDWAFPMNIKSEEERTFLHMNSIVGFPLLYYFLEKHGFKFQKTIPDRLRFWSVCLAVLFYPIIWWRVNRSCPKGHPLRKELTSLPWLAGRKCIVIAKVPGTFSQKNL